MNLEDRSVVVTGASTGIGRATARAFADAGTRVGLAARTTATLETLSEEIVADGGESLVLPSDVRVREELESAITTVRDTFGGLDVVVTNAGVGHRDRTGIVAGDLDE